MMNMSLFRLQQLFRDHDCDLRIIRVGECSATDCNDVYVGDNFSRETPAFVGHVVMPARTTGNEYGMLFEQG